MLALFAISCASYTPQTVALLRIQYATVSEVKHNVGIGVSPHLDRARNKEIFDADLKRAGILPLQIVVRNDRQSRITVRKDDFVLRLPRGEEYPPAPSENVASRLESNASVLGWTVAFGAIGFLAASTQTGEADNDRRADLRNKQLQDTTLSFQESARGFLFYLLPEDVNEVRGAKLFARAVDVDTGERIEMTLTLPDLEDLKGSKELDEQ